MDPVGANKVLSTARFPTNDGQDSAVSRMKIGAAVTELYAQRGDSLTDLDRAHIHDILRRVIRKLEADLRRRLSEILATSPHSPRDLVLLLANDEAEVAWPMLVNSAALPDGDLIDIIRARSTEHRMAIAARRRVSASVSAALVETGEQNVILRLLRNQDAEIGRATYEHLVEESQRIDEYQQPLLVRRDIPPNLLVRMYEWVGDLLKQQVRQRLGMGMPRETIDAALKTALTAEAAQDGQSASQQLASRLVETGAATPRLLTTLMSDGHISLLASIVSERTGIARYRVIEAVADAGGEPQAILCRAVGFSKDEFMTLLDESFRLCRRPEAAVARRRSHLSDMYPRLTEMGARRALAAWGAGTPILVALRQAEVN